MENKPYIKKYSEKNERGYQTLLNPITKNTPYITQHETTRSERAGFKNSKNNKKGVKIIVKKIGLGVFVKYKIVKQYFSKRNSKGKKEIQHYIPI